MDTVKHWFEYFESNLKLIQQPLNANEKKTFEALDLSDDYDPLYNAVHNAVIMNNVELLDMLHSKRAG